MLSEFTHKIVIYIIFFGKVKHSIFEKNCFGLMNTNKSGGSFNCPVKEGFHSVRDHSFIHSKR